MADDKQESAEAQEGKKKKGLPPIVLVVVGAALGGAGVVFMSPKPEPVEHAPPPVVVRLFDHPDPLEFTINPVVDRGLKTALITFKFSYKADEMEVWGEHGPPAHGDDAGGGGHGAPAAPAGPDGPVAQSIKLNWDRAYSRCLEVLTNQRVETLKDPEGKRQIKRMLKDELTASLFPDGNAEVDDILWTKFIVQ